jgi:phenylalanyl-tRNA synthetase beta chain
VADAFEAEPPITAFELDLASLVRAAKDVKPFADVPKFPAIDLDVALVVPEDVTAERVEQAVSAAGGKLLESARVFDVYRGTGVAPGRKSIAVALTYRATDRTLAAEEIEATHERLIRKVSGALGAQLRGA